MSTKEHVWTTTLSFFIIYKLDYSKLACHFSGSTDIMIIRGGPESILTFLFEFLVTQNACAHSRQVINCVYLLKHTFVQVPLTNGLPNALKTERNHYASINNAKFTKIRIARKKIVLSTFWWKCKYRNTRS